MIHNVPLITWRVWLKTEKEGSSALNQKLNFCTLLPQPHLHRDTVLQLGKNRLTAAVNWKLYYTQVKTNVGLDLDGIRCALIPSASCTWIEKRQWPLDLNLLTAPPNWNSNKLFFQTRRETTCKLQCKGYDRGLWFRFLGFATSVLNRRKIIIKRLIKLVRTYILHTTVPLKCLFI